MTSERQRLIDGLARDYCRLYPAEAAAEIERIASAEAARMLGSLAVTTAAAVLGRLSPDAAAAVVAETEASRAVALLEALDVATAAHLLARLSPNAREPLLAGLPDSEAAELRELISYPPQTAAAAMDPEVLALDPGRSVEDALRRLRHLRDRRIHRVYLIDTDRRLIGSVSVRDLALASPRTPLAELDVKAPSAVPAMATHDEVLQILATAQQVSLPVVDFDGRLLGVLRQDALVAATREQATADIQSMVGAGKEERALSKVRFAVRKRLPWLQVNLATAFLAATVVGMFEQTIARVTALAVLLPVVAGQSGNTGAQALAVTMRGLALREIRTSQWLRVCIKETKVGAVNGVAVALTTSLGVLIWSRSVGLALVIGSSMIIAMVAAGLAGAAVPMVLTSLRQDPAQSSSIILTTVTDVVGFFSFLGIATLLIGML